MLAGNVLLYRFIQHPDIYKNLVFGNIQFCDWFLKFSAENLCIYLCLTTRMERHRTEDGNWQFETVWNDYQLVLRSDNKDQGAKIAVSGCVKQESQSITSFSTVLTSEERYPLKIPDSVMQEEEIEQFQMLWELVRNFTEGRTQD